MKRALFCLKAASSAATFLQQFLLIYVLVRVVGAELYPWLVLLSSIGNYVLSADIGFSGYVFAHVRERFLRGALRETLPLIVNSQAIYFLVACAAFVVAALAIPATTRASGMMTLGLVLYFGSIVFSLPWTLVRRVATAIDLLLPMEALELVRRLALMLLAAAMLWGLSFPAFALCSLLFWLPTFVIAFALMRQRGVRPARVRPGDLGRFLRANRGNLFLTGGFTAMEFTIYNFPYLFLPLLHLGAEKLVFFDLFYRVTRFGGVAYAVPVETLLPFQTRAFYAGELGKVRRYQRLMLLLGLVPLACATLLLLSFGQRFFSLLLHDFPPVERGVLYVMTAMLACILLQCTAGYFLGATGQYARLARLAMGANALMALVALATWVLRLEFVTFLALYVGVYALYAASYQLAFLRMLRPSAGVSLPAGPAPAPPLGGQAPARGL